MNLREDDQVSAVALVVESEAATAATVLDEDEPGLVGEGEVGVVDAVTDAGAVTDAEAEADAESEAGTEPDAGVEPEDEA
jgi:hypothetical protein